MKRAAEVWAEDGPDRYESEEIAKQEARRQGFLAIAEKEPDRCVVIDAGEDLKTVNAQVDRIVDTYLEKSKGASSK